MTGRGDELDAARGRIAALEAEVTRLRARVADAQTVDDLRARLAQVGTAGVIGAPSEHNELLEQLVRTAMDVLRTRAGTLYLVDEQTGELIFEVALGEKAVSLRGQRMPISQGISGWVASTGQAIALADVPQDKRWAQELTSRIDYRPQTMLVVPLQLHDEVIGVLQLLDKEGGETFNAADMATLGLFAQQAAVAIAQSARVRSLSALLQAQLADLDGAGNLAARAGTLARRVEESVEYQEVLQIAAVVGGLIRQGEAERRLCREVVGALATYLRASGRSAPGP